MAVCEFCGQEMKRADGCTRTHIKYPDGTVLPVVTEHFDEPDGRCHDCGIKDGNAHHPGCDVERCPQCGGQLLNCWCFDEDDDELMETM